MPLFLLKFLGLLGTIKRLAVAGFKWATQSTARMLAVALVLALAWGAWERHRAAVWRGAAEKALAAVKTERAAYVAAQKGAEAKQAAQDIELLNTQIARNQALEVTHVRLEAERRDAVRDFLAARMHRDAECTASGSGEAGLPDHPRPDPERRTDGDFVALKPEEVEQSARIEVQNTERGEFIRGLIEQGLAIPESEWPKPAFGQDR